MTKKYNLKITNKSYDKTINVNLVNSDKYYWKDGQYLINDLSQLNIEVKKDPNFKIGRSRLDINKLSNN